MNQFLLFLFKVVVAMGFLSLFVLAVVFIKPLMINKKRPNSTVFLKFSYLFYLGIILCFFYYLIFQRKNLENLINDLHFFLLLGSLFIPNAGMLLRRRVSSLRSGYNYVLGLFHFLVMYYLLHMFVMIETFVE